MHVPSRFSAHVTTRRALRMTMAALLPAALAVATTGCSLVARMPAESATRSPASGAATPLGSGPAPIAVERPPVTGLPNVAQAAAEARPAVVFIATRSLGTDFFLNPVQQEGSGSGFIFDARGYVATNNHVVDGARNIQVTLPDGRSFDNAKVVGQDARTDLAVLKIDGASLPLARIGDSDQMRVGDWVVAIGNALGLDGGPTVTAGVVGALGRSIQESSGAVLEDLIQTDAAINPGNSGGPLVDLAGRVVGINTAIDTRGQGIGFAISINQARAIFDELIDKGRVARGVMGVNVATMTAALATRFNTDQKDGAVITGIGNGTPADRAGLIVRDIITNVDGQPIKNQRDLLRNLANRKPGDRITVAVVRGREERKVTLTLDESR